jgi:hypothetical protein
MESRLDALAKSLAGNLSRREALRTLGGSLAALLLSATGHAPAWAARGGNGKGGGGSGSSSGGDCTAWCKARFAPGAAQVQCKRVCDECGGNTSRLCSAGPNQGVLCCGEGEGCFATALGVPVCADLSSDEQNCGAIGSQCPFGWACCDGECKDLSDDPDNCGACGNECPPGGISPRCCDGVCTDVDSDPDNCGQCGRVCGGECTADGVCTCVGDDQCPPGETCAYFGACL